MVIKKDEKIPETFDPEQVTAINLTEGPVTFDLHVASHVASNELYKDVTFQDVEVRDGAVQGRLFNFGLKEATVPQVMISYYNDNKQLVDVQSYFIEEGIRSQRSTHFTIPIKFNSNEILSEDLSKCYVNGLPNGDLSPTFNRMQSQYNLGEFIPVKNGFIRLSLNIYTEEQ